MSCGYSKEILALYIEHDLPGPDAVAKAESHIRACAACREYCEQMRNTQSFIKDRFRPVPAHTVTPEMLSSVRSAVMSHVEGAQESLGWAIRLERFLIGGLRGHRYALAGAAFVAIVSASLLASIPYPSANASRGAAEFSANNTLVCPTDYREWVLAGTCVGHRYSTVQSDEMQHNVYVQPAAYREYAQTGKFPEGTVMVMAKDSNRFKDGWEFTPEAAGCISCHRDKAATGHVFTQFYPVSKGIGS
jgi:hypothetical protein